MITVNAVAGTVSVLILLVSAAIAIMQIRGIATRQYEKYWDMRDEFLEQEERVNKLMSSDDLKLQHEKKK